LKRRVFKRQSAHHNAVCACEKGQHVRHKALLAVGELVEIGLVVGQVDLLGRPEAGLGLLVGAPDLRVLDRKEHEALLVRLEDRLGRVDRVRLALGVHARWLRLPPDNSAAHAPQARGALAGRTRSEEVLGFLECPYSCV